MSQDIVICSPRRTAIGAFGGSLKDVPAAELGAHVIEAILATTTISETSIDSVVLGNVVQARNAMNPARQAAIKGGLAVETPAMTVNRGCGSGAQAVVTAWAEISSGFSKCVIAGGMENMERALYSLPSARWGSRRGDVSCFDAIGLDRLIDAFPHMPSGWYTEELVSGFKLSRAQQDEFSVRSQQRFVAAQRERYFDDEVVPILVPTKQGEQVFDKDEAGRPDVTSDTLSRLKPVFREGGTITEGNSPGINAGAAAMLVCTRKMAYKLGLQPIAAIRGAAVSGVAPGMFGLAPIPAIKQALARSDWTVGSVDRFEINEDFAAIALIVQRTLAIPDDRLNVDGGAIAHGHPIGATGAILITKVAHAMQRTGEKRSVVSLSIGGGQGIAICIEALFG